MEAIERRPLAATEVLDAAVKLVTARIRELATAILVIAVPIQILSFLYFLSLGDEVLAPRVVLAPADLVLGLAGLVAGALEYAVAVRIVASAYLGERPPWAEAMRATIGRLGAILAATVLFFLAVFVGIFALLIPGIFLAIALSVFLPALVLEGVSGPASLGRSYRLVRGRWLGTFVPLALAALAVVVLNLLVGGVVGGIFLRGVPSLGAFRLATAIVSLLSLAVGILTTALLAAVSTVAYFDLRVRKEGLDVELLARETPAEEPGPEPGPNPGPGPGEQPSS